MKITNLCPKSGKTTLSYQLFGKRGLILALEQGYSLLDGAMAININSYSDLNKVLKQLKDERVKSMYDVIIIDTVDLLHLLLEKHLCNTHGVSSINEVGAFGSGFAKLDSLVNDILLKITSYGYKLFIISHATPKKALINTPSGEIEVEKYFPSCPKRTYQIVSKFCDNIWYISMEMDADNKVTRKLYTRDNKISFGVTRMEHLPNVMPLDTESINANVKMALEKAGGKEDVKGFIPNYEAAEHNFDEVKNTLIELVQQKFMPTNKMDIVKEITEKHLGVGFSIMSATPNQVESLVVILDELKSL